MADAKRFRLGVLLAGLGWDVDADCPLPAATLTRGERGTIVAPRLRGPMGRVRASKVIRVAELFEGVLIASKGRLLRYSHETDGAFVFYVRDDGLEQIEIPRGYMWIWLVPCEFQWRSEMAGEKWRDRCKTRALMRETVGESRRRGGFAVRAEERLSGEMATFRMKWSCEP